MRPAVTIGTAATVLSLAVTGYAGARRTPEPKPVGMIYRHEQSPAGIRVIIRNPSREWTLRGQRVIITMFSDLGNPVRSYGPSGKWGRSLSDPLRKTRPQDVIECCYLPDLAPGEEHVFTLWQVRYEIRHVEIDPVDTVPVWEHTGT